MKDTILKFRKSKDGEGRDSITIQIDDKGVFIPLEVLTQFIDGEDRGTTVYIYND